MTFCCFLVKSPVAVWTRHIICEKQNTDAESENIKLCLFSYPSVKTYVLGAQKNRLIETVLLSTHNICFGREIRKLNFCYALLTEVLNDAVISLRQTTNMYLNSI